MTRRLLPPGCFGEKGDKNMKVKNRSASVVGYKVPDLNVRRRFVPGEIKEIPVEELQQLL